MDELKFSKDFNLTQYTVQKSKYLTDSTIATNSVDSPGQNTSKHDKINEHYYKLWFDRDFSDKERVKLNERVIEELECEIERIKINKYCRSCFDLTKTFLYFNEGSLENETKHTFIFTGNAFELLSNESHEEEEFLFKFCSVIRDRGTCMKLFSKIHNKSIPWKQFKIILENWGWQSDANGKGQPVVDNTEDTPVLVAEHNLFCILQLVKNSVKQYSCEELRCLINILSNFCIDSLCVGLGTPISQNLEAAISVLINKFNITKHDIVCDLKIEGIPLSCVLRICSKIACKTSFYSLAFLFALTYVCEWYGCVYSFKSDVTIQTVLKILLVIREKIIRNIDDACSCLALIGFVISRLVINANEVQKVKDVAIYLTKMKIDFNYELKSAIFAESANRVVAICWSKIEPFQTFESKYELSFC